MTGPLYKPPVEVGDMLFIFKFNFSRIWLITDWWIFTDLSEKIAAFIFRSKTSKSISPRQLAQRTTQTA
jgi:uncharacterized iron-regulated protein